jgi:hypothetical protein
VDNIESEFFGLCFPCEVTVYSRVFVVEHVSCGHGHVNMTLFPVGVSYFTGKGVVGEDSKLR